MLPDKTKINPDSKADIDAYIDRGRPVGGFLYAVLTNNLKDSIANGDSDAIDNIPHIVAYLYNDCRMDCWGSPEIVAKWFESKMQTLIKVIIIACLFSSCKGSQKIENGVIYKTQKHRIVRGNALHFQQRELKKKGR